MTLRDFLNIVSSWISVKVFIDKDSSGFLISASPSDLLHFLNDLALNSKILEIFDVSDCVIYVLIDS